MTLSTYVRPLDPIDHRRVFLLARKVAGIPGEWPFVELPHIIRHEPGCPGVRCRVDSLLYGFYPDDEDITRHGWHVRFESGAMPDRERLHAGYVSALFAELAAVGVSAEWQNEYTGEWFTEPPGDVIDHRSAA